MAGIFLGSELKVMKPLRALSLQLAAAGLLAGTGLAAETELLVFAAPVGAAAGSGWDLRDGSNRTLTDPVLERILEDSVLEAAYRKALYKEEAAFEQVLEGLGSRLGRLLWAAKRGADTLLRAEAAGGGGRLEKPTPSPRLSGGRPPASISNHSDALSSPRPRLLPLVLRC